MGKKTVINASPDLRQAAQRKREKIEFVRENLIIPSSLREHAKGRKYFIADNSYCLRCNYW